MVQTGWGNRGWQGHKSQVTTDPGLDPQATGQHQVHGDVGGPAVAAGARLSQAAGYTWDTAPGTADLGQTLLPSRTPAP